MSRLVAVFFAAVFVTATAIAQEKSPDLKAESKVSDRKPLTVYFEQAQQRANHAHDELMAAQRKLKQAVRAERSAEQELTSAQRKYEEAKRRAESATQAMQTAQADEAAAQGRWSKESEALRQAHREMETGSPAK